MAITTYSELVTAIQAWMMDRSDLAGPAQDFITLGENYLNYGGGPEDPPLRVREMETIATITPVAGVGALPTDYLEWRRVSLSSPRGSLTWVEPGEVDILYPSRAGGVAQNFTTIGSNIYSYPTGTTGLEMVYYARIPALTAAAPTNWLLSKSPSVYLRAALAQAADYIKHSEELPKQVGLLRAAVAGLNQSDFMGNYARAGLTLRGITP